MSSLLIKGMQLPRKSEHRECNIAVVQNCPVFIAFLRTKTNPLECFECAEIPTPHGRLIDADRLLALIESECNENCKGCEGGCCAENRFDIILSAIKNAPTVIEAEVSE